MSGINKAWIVGGGIGGFSTAIDLRKAGIHADIVEIKERWEVHPVGIIVHANFLRAMVALLRLIDSQSKRQVQAGVK